MQKTTGVKVGHIVQVMWRDSLMIEYYSSVAALFIKNGETKIGAKRTTILCNLSRKQWYENSKARIEYVPIYMAVRTKQE